jgi:IS30 family transposase
LKYTSFMLTTKKETKMSYKRVTIEERSQIWALLQAGKGNNEIARLLGRNKSTISREISRNRGRRGYRWRQANRLAIARARRPGPRRFTEAVKLDVEEKLHQGWTPEMICGRAALEGRAHVSKETVYKYIYADAKSGGDLWRCLPRSKRMRKRRCPRQDGRGRGIIPGRRGIEQRSIEVLARGTVGHWEGDLVVGAQSSGYLVTLVERKTRFTVVAFSPTKEANAIKAAIIAALAPFIGICDSITFDNGKEFAQHTEMGHALGADIFFATPYHSWERGTNENTNGLIRRLYPKSSSFAVMGEQDLRRIDTFLNDRPRKCLGWKTPREVMDAFLAEAA